MLKNARILVVDDEPAIRDICRRTLSAHGYQVQTAATGEEALPLLRAGDPELVLTDLVMPGTLNGSAFVEEIKRHSPSTDVIVMTGFPALETAIPTLKSGASDYLIKPFEQEFLRSTVERCLEMRRISGELNREKRLRLELEAAYSQLQEMERLKEAFIARANHELRIPLTPLFLAMNQLRDLAATPKSRALCSLFEERLNRLHDVVENVLLFSDLRPPEGTCSKKELNARELLLGIVRRFRALWQEKQLTVEMHWEPEAEKLNLDPRLIETAFKSFFLNAIQFNRKQGKIHIQARRVHSQVEISFADTGIGIPENKLSQIFDSFYQVAEYLTREVGGIGLGLTLARRIVEFHGGSIRVESREGEGSVFTVVLPAE